MTGPLCGHIIPGYSFISQPSLSSAAVAGFFVSHKLNYSIRDDLSQSTNDYECLWIEIQSGFKDDLICAVINRHPHSDHEAFLNEIIDKINREKK
jgi:hypothetical protein